MKKFEWIIHRGIIAPKNLYIWHFVCEPVWNLYDHQYAVVGSYTKKCSNCQKEPPNYIWFQYKLLGGDRYD